MNNTTLIDQYLQNEMTLEARAAFEQRLLTDAALQEEVLLQQKIIAGIKNAGLKQEFSKAIRKQRIIKNAIRWGVAVLIGATILATVHYYKSHAGSSEPVSFSNNKDSLKIQQFNIATDKDTIVETSAGLVFAIPAHAFNSGNSNIQLNIKSATNAYEIIRAGLSTMSNEAMLQTAGMFYIDAFDNGKPVSLVKNINVSVPADSINPKMMLFDGIQNEVGKINWVNPTTINRELRTYDITKLDFYPAKYIPVLKSLKQNVADKRFTDSLYYSFSGLRREAEKPLQLNGKAILKIEFPVQKNDKPNKSDLLKLASQSGLDTTNNWGSSFEIDPSRIKAIWNKTFNNTILATKEFEERLRFIHTTCEPAYLDFYIRNLKKPLYEIDRLCANYASSDVKKKFLQFAARQDGIVMIADGLQEKLSVYFQQKYTAYKQAAEKTWQKYEAELNRLNNEADGKRQQHNLEVFARADKNLKEEFCINLSDAYRQIGVAKSCDDTLPPPAKNYYNFNISSTGWKNLDQYVFSATQSRQSMTYTDPANGKTATLTYKSVVFKIADETNFDNVLVYLIPNQLSSFQNVLKKENGYEENLNMLLQYDAVVLAYKGQQAYFAKLEAIDPKLYSISLQPITDKDLKTALQNYPVNKQRDFLSEAAYQLFEQKETIRQLNLQKDREMRRQIEEAIFPCNRSAMPGAAGVPEQ